MWMQHLPLPLLSNILSPTVLLSLSLFSFSLSLSLSLSLTIVQSPHSYIPICGQNLPTSCGAAKGVTEGCLYQMLLLTSLGQMEQEISLPEHVNSFASSKFTPRLRLEFN